MFFQFPKMLTNFSYVCQSVSWHNQLLKLGLYRDISYSDEISFRIFWETFLNVLHYFQTNTNYFYVCQYVRQLTSVLILGQMQGYHLFWMIYLTVIFLEIPGMFVHYFPIITNLLFVCQSVSWLTSLQKLDQYRDISCPG